MSIVREHVWIWGHEAGSHNNAYGLPCLSRMTPAEGAFYLGVPNMILVRYNDLPAPPYEQYAMALSPLKRLVWSIVGAGGTTDSEEIERVRALVTRFSNIDGVMMDDFFSGDPNRVGVHTPEHLQAIRDRLIVSDRKLDLWVVLYQHQLDLPVGNHLRLCDVVTFWTWWAERLEVLEQNFEQFERIAPSSRKVLGCYMWDYGNHKPMPVPLMEKQCRLGLRLLREGRIEGMIFLASCICDLGLEAVEWTREWIQEVGNQSL